MFIFSYTYQTTNCKEYLVIGNSNTSACQTIEITNSLIIHGTQKI